MGFPRWSGVKTAVFTTLATLLLTSSSGVYSASPLDPLCLKQRVKNFLLGVPSAIEVDAKKLMSLKDNPLVQRFFRGGASQEQRHMINQALALKESDGFLTPEAFARQTRLLEGAGVKRDELVAMRETGLLGSLRTEAVAVQDTVKVDFAALRPIGKEEMYALQGTRKGIWKTGTPPEKLQYVVDFENNIFVADKVLTNPENNFWIINNVNEEGNGAYVLVREAGELKYNVASKRQEFTPQYSLFEKKSDTIERLSKLKKENPEIEIDYHRYPLQQETRVVDCMEYSAGRQKGKGFIRDSLVSTNINYLEGIFFINTLEATTEDKKPKTDEARKRARTSDWVANNFNSLLNSQINLHVLSRNFEQRYGLAGYGMTLGTRFAASTGFVGVQHLGYKKAFEGMPEGDSQRKALDTYNLIHTYAKLPVNEFVDRALLHDMPLRLFENCLKGGKVWMLINPTTIRIVERHASMGIYWGGRWIFVESKFGHEKSAHEKSAHEKPMAKPSPSFKP